MKHINLDIEHVKTMWLSGERVMVDQICVCGDYKENYVNSTGECQICK